MISRAEYEARQARFRSVLAAEGFDGALVVSRGGSTLDRYAQVLYLTGHYQSYSYLPDAPSLFSGRSHAAVVLDASGRIALCVSVPEFDASALAVDDVRVSDDFAGTVASAFQDFALTAARVALVGADVLPLRIWRDLRARVSAAEFQDADELLMALRLRKSPAEQDAIRRAAAVHRQGMTAVLNAIRPGQRESDLVGTFADVVMREGAGLYFTSLSSGAATRRWASAASPGFSLRRLESGDLLRFDSGIVLNGYLSDFGRAAVVGEPDDGQLRLLDVLHGGLEAAISAVRPGARVADVVAAGEAALADAGVISQDDGSGRILSSFPVHWGHGLGLGWERPYLTAGEEMRIETGMYLAIERALTLPGVGTAAAEQTLLVASHGADVLTAGPSGFWS